MLLDTSVATLPRPAVLVTVGVLALVVQLIRTWATLRHVPGPFWSKITNIPRVRWVLSNRAHDYHIALHEKYGPLVRFGPNMVSIGDPAEIPNVYGFTGKFVKVCLVS
jgi:hypothetical protein